MYQTEESYPFKHRVAQKAVAKLPPEIIYWCGELIQSNSTLLGAVHDLPDETTGLVALGRWIRHPMRYLTVYSEDVHAYTLKDKLYLRIARWSSDKVIYWAGVRIINEASEGDPEVEIPAITFTDAMLYWCVKYGI